MIKIYHNEKCSKSRETLDLIRRHGIEPTIIDYLRDPPDVQTLKNLLKVLGMSAKKIIRKKEKLYLEKNLSDPLLSEGDLLEAMSANPSLIERPIVVKGSKAILGRPPENVIGLL